MEEGHKDKSTDGGDHRPCARWSPAAPPRETLSINCGVQGEQTIPALTELSCQEGQSRNRLTVVEGRHPWEHSQGTEAESKGRRGWVCRLGIHEGPRTAG